jgi:hypothetical protein
MIAINRTAIVRMPGQALLDWLHRVDPTSGGLSLEDFRREPTVCLLPECGNEEEARGHLEEVRGGVFREQLTGWCRVPSLWPSRRDLDAFDRWFEWSFRSVVAALRDAPLLQEEI